ncbi:hypothetical protein [Streptomyces sediminimaris]|uniref:hypothetical protein n=1 Tax=Streptomyces sediminimaris TaxID=3383721 RepID=UPI00399A9E86
MAATGLAAVLFYRYVHVGSVGPPPTMYEPPWYPERTASAVAEAAAMIIAAAGLLLTHRLGANSRGSGAVPVLIGARSK